MKKYIAIFVIFALAVFLPFDKGVVWADEDSEQSIHVELSGGASFNGNNDSPNKAAEYRSLSDEDTVGIFGGSVDVRSGDIEFGAEGMRFDSQDQEYGGYLDVNRIFELHGGYQEFLHRLGQDDLLHIQGTSAAPGQGAQMWHSYEYAPELDVNSENLPKSFYKKNFGVQYEKYDATTILRLPMLPNVKAGMHYRYENREGHQQAMGMSKCGSCHVVAHDKDIDETTQDFKPFVEVNFGQLSMEYSFLYRTFDNASDHLYHLYDPAVHPLKGTVNPYDPSDTSAWTFDKGGGFNYDYRNGPLELSRTPETTKTVHHVKGKYDISKNQSVSFGYIHSFAENQSADEYGIQADNLDTTYDAGMANWTAKLTRDLLVSLNGRYQTIDSDSADIGLIDIDGDSHGWKRKSDEERDVVNARADVRYRVLRSLTLRGGYEYENEDRRSQDFLVDRDITTQKIKTKAKWRPFSSLSVTAGYKFTFVDDPYALEDAACPTHIDLGVDDNTGIWDGYINDPITGRHEVGAPRAAGKYIYGDYVYGARTHNMSADPEYEHEAKMKANWNPMAQLFVSAYTRYVHGGNDEDLEYKYKDDRLDSGVDVTVAPMDKLSMTLGYNYLRHNMDSEFYIPYYHG